MNPAWRQKCPACGGWIAEGTGEDTRAVPACDTCGWRAVAVRSPGRVRGHHLIALLLVAAGAAAGWAAGRAGSWQIAWATAGGAGPAAAVSAWSRGLALPWALLHAAAHAAAFHATAPMRLEVGERTPVAIGIGVLTLVIGRLAGAWSRRRDH